MELVFLAVLAVGCVIFYHIGKAAGKAVGKRELPAAYRNVGQYRGSPQLGIYVPEEEKPTLKLFG